MIDPRDPICTIISQYPSVRNVYEAMHIIEDDSIDTECFCEKYDIPFFDLWMSISKVVSKIDSEKRKVELERERVVQKKNNKEKAPKSRYQKNQMKRFKDMTDEERVKMIFALFLSFVGVILFFVSRHYQLEHFWEALGVGLSVTGSTVELRLVKKDDK